MIVRNAQTLKYKVMGCSTSLLGASLERRVVTFSGMVDLEGFEPSTSSMPWKRAPNCATGPYR